MDPIMRLAEWLWNLNPKNRAWLAEQMPPTKASEEELARIDAEIKALLAKRPVTNA